MDGRQRKQQILSGLRARGRPATDGEVIEICRKIERAVVDTEARGGDKIAAVGTRIDLFSFWDAPPLVETG